MPTLFQEVLSADPETLAGMLTSPEGEDATVEGIARRLRLHKAELVSAVGFNPAARTLGERLAVLGYPGFEALLSHRDLLFATDAYRRLSLRDCSRSTQRSYPIQRPWRACRTSSSIGSHTSRATSTPRSTP
ncbi:MAG: hypothetical protein LC647_04340 [Beggiatoa sp.]|nr:hypothetical protein [Beggiatoa sp.]